MSRDASSVLVIERYDIASVLKDNMGLSCPHHSVPSVTPDPKIFIGVSDHTQPSRYSNAADRKEGTYHRWNGL
jgi:hypothetical protein